MKVIKATKYLDIHYFQIADQHAPHKILSHHNFLLQVTSIQVYNNKSISNKKTQSYKLVSIKKFRGVKPGICFCPSAVRNRCQLLERSLASTQWADENNIQIFSLTEAFRGVVTQVKDIFFKYFFFTTTIRALVLGHAGGRLVEYTNSALTAWGRTQKKTIPSNHKTTGRFSFSRNQH